MFLDGHKANDVVYYWRDGANSVILNSEIMLPLFDIKGVETSNELIVLAQGENSLKVINALINVLFLGNYSRVSISLEFQRSIEYYLVQVYTPCNMIVIMAWISFFLNKNASNIRIVMCLVGLLSLIVEIQCINNFVPKTSYVKALDIYTGVCMTLVFLALVGE